MIYESCEVNSKKYLNESVYIDFKNDKVEFNNDLDNSYTFFINVNGYYTQCSQSQCDECNTENFNIFLQFKKKVIQMILEIEF